MPVKTKKNNSSKANKKGNKVRRELKKEDSQESKTIKDPNHRHHNLSAKGLLQIKYNKLGSNKSKLEN